MYGDDSYIANTQAKESQIAGFADLTYSITEQLKVTAGARYAKTKFSFVNFADGSQNYGRTGGEGSASEKQFTPQLSVSLQDDPNNLIRSEQRRVGKECVRKGRSRGAADH